MERLKHHAHTALRKSEKYFKTDMVYLAKGGFWLGAGQIVASLTAFLLAIAFGNLLSPEIFGTYKYVISVAGIIATLSLTGLSTAVAQSVARGFNGALQQAFRMNLEWSWLVALASFFTTGYYFLNDNATLGFAFLVVGIFTPFLNSTTFFSSFLSGKKDFKTQSLYGAINSILPALALIITIFFTNNLFVIVLAYFTSQAVVEYSLYLLVIKKYRPNKEEIDPEMFSYGAHVSAMNILGTIAIRLDSILIFHYLGAAQLAIYAFAFAIPEQIRGFVKNIASTAFPKWSNKTLTEIHKTLGGKIQKFIFVLTGITLFYIIIAPTVYKIFFPYYINSIFYSQIFAFSLIASASIIPTTILQSQKMTRELYQLNMVSAFIQIFLLAIFVPKFGIMGAILAVVIARIFGLILGFFLIRVNP